MNARWQAEKDAIKKLQDGRERLTQLETELSGRVIGQKRGGGSRCKRCSAFTRGIQNPIALTLLEGGFEDGDTIGAQSAMMRGG